MILMSNTPEVRTLCGCQPEAKFEFEESMGNLFSLEN